MAGGEYNKLELSKPDYNFRDVERREFLFDFADTITEPESVGSGLSENVELPDVLSCRTGLSRSQEQSFTLIISGLGIAGLFVPNLLLAGLSCVLWTVFAGLILWRFALISVGWRVLRRSARPIRRRKRVELPIYSILIPVYDEAPIMRQLARAVGRLDWPKDRLDIQILLEDDDPQTLIAAQLAGFPLGTRFTIIPAGGPRTKPNALNYGLAQARGMFVCIYDAEDRPAPQQLREAYDAFERKGPQLACVQAPLIASNMSKHLLSAHWGLEYAVQFGLLLPTLAGLKLPILVGGTSNHFRLDVLKASGGWDAWNVTEDADLGMRLARFGYHVGLIRAGTLEDAPTCIRIWHAQRSRWIKGFIKTWLVLMRSPRRVRREMGTRNFIAAQFMLGGAIFAPLLHLPFVLIVMASLQSAELTIGAMGWALIVFGFFVCALGDCLAPGKWSWMRVAAVVTRPLYWPLHSIAAYRALWELAERPHFWAKTPHCPVQSEAGDDEEDHPCSTGSSV